MVGVSYFSCSSSSDESLRKTEVDSLVVSVVEKPDCKT